MNRIAKHPFSYWPYAIICSFILLAIFDAGIVRLALTTAVSPMEASPYEAGLQYEAIVRAKQAAVRDGVLAQVSTSGRAVVVKFSGLKESGTGILDLKLLKPDDATLDRHLTLHDGGGGRFVGSELPLKAGLWLIQGMLTDGLTQYYFDSQLMVSDR